MGRGPPLTDAPIIHLRIKLRSPAAPSCFRSASWRCLNAGKPPREESLSICYRLGIWLRE